MVEINLAESDEAVRRCYPVMVQLRPHLSEPAFVEQVRRQQKRFDYCLAYAAERGKVTAVAGFRISECLAWGKFLYVDDLVTDSTHRSHGLGKRLFDWLVKRASEEGCDQLHLDSGVQRFEAHRFYLREQMHITSHHFAIDLRAVAE